MATNNAVNTTLSGQTGTGSFAGSATPTLTTPVIAQIKDSNGNVQLNFTSVASAVNYVSIVNAATLTNPQIGALGTDTNILLKLSGKGTSGVQLQGTSTNDNSPTGYYGELKSSVVAVGTPVNLSTGTTADVTSLSLTAGDWDLWGEVAFQTATTTSITQLIAGTSDTATTLKGPIATDYGQTIYVYAAFVPGVTTIAFTTPIGRVSLASTTTVYLNCQATFTISTLISYGVLMARRRR